MPTCREVAKNLHHSVQVHLPALVALTALAPMATYRTTRPVLSSCRQPSPPGGSGGVPVGSTLFPLGPCLFVGADQCRPPPDRFPQRWLRWGSNPGAMGQASAGQTLYEVKVAKSPAWCRLTTSHVLNRHQTAFLHPKAARFFRSRLAFGPARPRSARGQLNQTA